MGLLIWCCSIYCNTIYGIFNVPTILVVVELDYAIIWFTNINNFTEYRFILIIETRDIYT